MTLRPFCELRLCSHHAGYHRKIGEYQTPVLALRAFDNGADSERKLDHDPLTVLMYRCVHRSLDAVFT